MEFINHLSFKGIVPIEHSSEMDWEGSSEWTEVKFNYRLELCDDVFFIIDNNEILAHVGLSENQIKTVYVKDEHRRKGIATRMYKELFKLFPVLLSDDAREEPAQIIWERLKEEYPDNIFYNKRKDRFEYKQTGWND